MTELQKVQLGILKELLRVCGELGLRCHPIGGTLLGAARHGGFIPWDDDIDVIMPRADYDCLIKKGPAAFKSPYFLQCPLTEQGFWRSHVQIRKRGTVGCIPDDLRRPGEKGVFIDVFVLDVLPPRGFGRFWHLSKMRFLNKLGHLAMDCGCGHLSIHSIVDRLIMLLFRPLLKRVDLHALFRAFNEIAGEYRNLESETVAHTTFRFFAGKEWRRDWFEGTVSLPFEDLSVPCPVGYGKILRKQYGKDCMEIPRHAPTSHGSVVTSL